MSKQYCGVVTKEIESLASNFPNEPVSVIKNIVEIIRNSKGNIDAEVSIEEIQNIIDSRAKNPFTGWDSNSKLTVNKTAPTLNYDVQTFKDRTHYIAKLFTLQVDSILETTKQELKNAINNSEDVNTKQQLQSQLNTLSRMDIINQYTPGAIFNIIKGNVFISYINDSMSNKIASELQIIEEEDWAIDSTVEFKTALAKKNAEYKTAEYKKIINNYDNLTINSLPILRIRENIQVDMSSADIEEAAKSKADVYDETGELLEEDETTKGREGWMVNFRQVNSYSSITEEIKAVLSNIPKYDKEGFAELDDLGNHRNYNPEYIHSSLLDVFLPMTNSNDMIPLLEKNISKKYWLTHVIDRLEEDESLKSSMYSHFNTVFTNYWIQKSTLANGEKLSYNTIAVNKPNGIHYLIDSWRDTYESRTRLVKNTVYNNDGTLNTENAKQSLDKTKELLSSLYSISDSDARVQLVGSEDFKKDLDILLKSVAIETDPIILEEALLGGSDTFTPVHDMLQSLSIIFDGIVKNKVEDSVLENNIVVLGDLINTFDSAYSKIAYTISNVIEDATERVFRENNKGYYSHSKPAYLGKMVKELKNTMKDENRFAEFIEKEFKQFDFLYDSGTDTWKNDWLQQLVENPVIRNGFEHKVVLHLDNVEYSDLQPLNMALMMLNEYSAIPNQENSNIKWANYKIPILSDAPSAEFLKFRKYTNDSILNPDTGEYLSYKDIILDKMKTLLYQEYSRISLVRERDFAFQNGENIYPIESFDIVRNSKGEISLLGGSVFRFLPQLNYIADEQGRTFLQQLDEYLSTETEEITNDFITSTLTEIMNKEFDNFVSEYRKLGILDKTAKGDMKYLPFTGDNSENIAINYLSEYFWNSTHATSQIIQLTTTDLAFYGKVKADPKNTNLVESDTTMETFQKRYKEIHAPSKKVDTNATYNGEVVGTEFERNITFSDNIILSESFEDIKEVFAIMQAAGVISKNKFNSIVNSFKEINTADAQAYRTLPSYRKVKIMLGEWSEDLETAYNNIESGTWTLENLSVFMQPLKPYLYTQVGTESGISGYSKIKTPVQHKNSEFPIISVFATIAGSLDKNSVLAGIDKFMRDNDIDVAQFESTTKVGKKGLMYSTNDSVTSKEVYDNLTKELLGSSGYINDNLIYTVPYADYGIQTETPEHLIDATKALGTQQRRLIMEDSKEGIDSISLGNANSNISRKEYTRLYNEAIVNKAVDAWDRTTMDFSTNKQLSDLLVSMMQEDSQYTPDMIESVRLNDKGEFNTPLYDMSISNKIQSLLGSIVRNRISKQRTSGGEAIQVTAFGIQDPPKIVFEGEGANKRIKYVECYIPVFSNKLFEFLIDENGILDVNRLPDSLRRAVGYRIPTEGKQSMLPLYIKGFLPQQNGSSIILPKDITNIAGSDFDVDKLNLMFQDFYISRYIPNKSKFLKDFAKSIDINYKDFKTALESTYDEVVVNKMGVSKGSREEKLLDFYKNYDKESKVVITGYNVNDTEKNTEGGNNNLLFDIMYGILTHPVTAGRLLTPSNYDYYKKTAKIVNILKDNSLESLKKEFGISSTNDVIKTLSNLSVKELVDLSARTRPTMNPLSPLSQVVLHKQIMAGGKLIGIYANHKSNNATMQFTNLKVKDSFKFTLNGNDYISLHKELNKDKELISNLVGGSLTAAVDNGKDPVLSDMNLNTFTADASMVIVRLGHNPETMGLFLSQPIIEEMTSHYFNNMKSGMSKIDAIGEVLSKYAELGGIKNRPTMKSVSQKEFPVSYLASSIAKYKEILENPDSNRTSFYSDQYNVGVLFQHIFSMGEHLGDLVKATKADTQNGSARATIAETISLVEKTIEVMENSREDSYPFDGADLIDVNIDLNQSASDIRKDILNSKLPSIQAFFTLGLQGYSKLLDKYFPHFNNAFNSKILDLKSISKSGRLNVKTRNDIYNSYLSYIMTSGEFLGAQKTPNNNTVSIEEKRNYFVNTFPTVFDNIKSDNKDIANIGLVQRIKYIKPNRRNPVGSLVFRNVGSLSEGLKLQFSNDWKALLQMDNPVANKLAIDLLSYNFFRYSLSYGGSSFAYLAPMEVRNAVPDYFKTMRSALSIKDNNSNFSDQYILHNLGNKQLVPRVEVEDVLTFVKEGFIGDSFEVDIQLVSDAVTGLKRGDLLFPYIAIVKDGSETYYTTQRAVDADNKTSSTVLYTKIMPLSFNEFEYGKNGLEINSVIGRQAAELNVYNNTTIEEGDSPSSSSSNTNEDNFFASVDNQDSSKKQEYNDSLNSKLTEILTSWGISIGTLNEADRRLGIAGIADFNRAKVTADGFVELIRLAQGNAGKTALPEEFSHVVVSAMSNDPLMQRLLSYIKDKNLHISILGEEYLQYSDLYNNNSDRLAEEAAGKLLAKHLIKQEPISNTVPYKNLLLRIIDSFIKMFSRFRAAIINDAVINLDKEFGNIAREILTNNITVDPSKITSSNAYYKVSEKVSRDKKILQDIIKNEYKRIDLVNKKKGDSKFGAIHQDFISKLEDSLDNNESLEGIYDFVGHALDKLKKVEERMDIFEEASVAEKASLARDVRNYLYSYKNLLKDINAALVTEKDFDSRYVKKLVPILDETIKLSDRLFIKYNEIAMPSFIEFIKPYIQKGMKSPYGKTLLEELSVEEVLKRADKDIGFWDHWVHSMANSSDITIKALDNVIKESKEKIRRRVLSLSKEIQAAAIEAEQSGIKTFDWMYEKDSKGNLTGKYIRAYNMQQYIDARKEFYKQLTTKYGKNPVGIDARNYNLELREWYYNNLDIVDGRKLPKVSIYGNNVYKNMSPAQKKFYNTIIDIKTRLDDYLPSDQVDVYNIIAIEKDLLERVKASKDVKSGVVHIWESMKSTLTRRVDDSEFGYKFNLQDFEGNKVQVLPIYYTNPKRASNINDLSTDIVSTLMSYSDMAINYNEMGNILDHIELGRDLLRERDVIQTSSGNPIKEKLNIGGKVIESYLTKKQYASRIQEKLDAMFDMQVYGRYIEDEGSVAGIDKAKGYNFINSATSLANTALNALSAIANVTNGAVMFNIEAASSEFFSPKNALKGDKVYSTEMPSYMAEIGKRVKTNKLALWLEHFNVLQEHDSNIKNANFDRKNWFSRMFSMNTLFLLSNAGEHWMQSRTSLALADSYKMKSPSGKIVSLWDAMEVKYIDPSNKSKGGTLTVKSGYTKVDGTEFTNEDVFKFSQKVKGINQRMYGIYNKEDQSAVQKIGIGRLAFMYRKWIPSALLRRFGKENYNYDLDSWTKGYYRSFGGFAWQLLKDLKRAEFTMATKWKTLDNREKANMKRALTELGHFLSVATVLGLAEWPDKEDRPWHIQMVEYQMRRMYTELGVLIPGPSMFTEGLKVIQSPAAGINTIENWTHLINLLWLPNYFEEIEDGRYEDRTVAGKALEQSRIIPMKRTLEKVFDPNDALAFYKQ